MAGRRTNVQHTATPGQPVSSPAGSPTARARRDRGGETRERLIEAAIDVFGRHGYEGATTRQIAKAADANLAAIVYHFGSKEALYLAVAEHIVVTIDQRLGPVLAFVEASFPKTPPEAVAFLKRMLGAFVDVILGNPEAQRWARIIIRELLDPSDAFDVIYGFTGRVHTLATRLVAVAAGSDPESTETKLRTFSVIGQGLVFRVGNAMVLRRIGREELGPEERETIKRILWSNVDAMFAGGGDARA